MGGDKKAGAAGQHRELDPGELGNTLRPDPCRVHDRAGREAERRRFETRITPTEYEWYLAGV